MKKRYFIAGVLSTIILVALYSCISTQASTYRNGRICSDYSTTSISQLPIGLIKDMVKGYQENQLSEIENNLNITDARAISFDLATLKRFIYHIEAEARNKNADILDEDLGIRIYYAAYPKRESWNDQKYGKALEGFEDDSFTKEYGNLHTVLMIPTIRRDSMYYDFNPKEESTYTKRLQDFFAQQDTGYFTNPTNTFPVLSFTTNRLIDPSDPSRTISQNHGGLFPPRSEDGLGF